MSWFAFHGYNNGQPISASPFDEAELDAVGMHGYATPAQAKANPNSVNIFQAPLVNAAIDDYNNARNISTIQGKVTNAAKGAANAAKVLTNPGDWLKSATGWIGQQNIWVRGGEIVVGILVLYIGLKAAVSPGNPSTTAIGKQGVKSTVSNVKRVAKFVK